MLSGRWMCSQPWWKLTFCYPETSKLHQVPHSCPVSPFQKGVQFYLDNNKPQKDQKFSMVIVETMENMLSLFFVLLQHRLLAVPSHSDQTRIPAAFSALLAYFTFPKYCKLAFFMCWSTDQRAAGKEADGQLHRSEKQNKEGLTPVRKLQRF